MNDFGLGWVLVAWVAASFSLAPLLAKWMRSLKDEAADLQSIADRRSFCEAYQQTRAERRFVKTWKNEVRRATDTPRWLEDA